jgi:hypothetical protein
MADMQVRLDALLMEIEGALQDASAAADMPFEAEPEPVPCSPVADQAPVILASAPVDELSPVAIDAETSVQAEAVEIDTQSEPEAFVIAAEADTSPQEPVASAELPPEAVNAAEELTSVVEAMPDEAAAEISPVADAAPVAILPAETAAAAPTNVVVLHDREQAAVRRRPSAVRIAARWAAAIALIAAMLVAVATGTGLASRPDGVDLLEHFCADAAGPCPAVSVTPF